MAYGCESTSTSDLEHIQNRDHQLNFLTFIHPSCLSITHSMRLSRLPSLL